jgi:alkylated DNA nucleotide flippase Atl1
MTDPIPLTSGRIFLSYRREDTRHVVGRIGDRLTDHFGDERVFVDVDTIEPGQDFAEAIQSAVGACKVLLALIGDQWLDSTDRKGRRKLDDANDLVRLEIQAALDRNIRVIPVLVDGVAMPTAEELPPSLAGLARRHAFELSYSRFRDDARRLVGLLDRLLAAPSPGPPPPVPPAREKSTVQRLVAARSIPDGTPLTLRPTTEVTAEVRVAVEAWVKQDPRRGRSRWYNDRRTPLAWEYDGGRYRPTEIVRRILADAAGVQRSPRGPAWWVLQDGRDLPTVAGVPERSTFDWAELHQVLAAIPAGRWTTYGELAGLIGTAAQPLGQHIQHCPACPNAQRVLGADGKPRPGFSWGDPKETRSQQDWLEAEGVRFSDGAADPTRHLDAAALAALVEPRETGYLAAGADDFLAIIPTAPPDQQIFLQRLADWAVTLDTRGLTQLSTYHGKAGIRTLLPRLSDGAGLVTIYKDTRSSYLQFWRSVFERRAPRALAAVEAALGEPGVRQGNVVREASDQLLSALTAAYEEAATGQLTT